MGPQRKNKQARDVAVAFKDSGAHPFALLERTRYPISLAQYIHKTKDYYRISASVKAIQESIMLKGPVVCGYRVYESFNTWFNNKQTKNKVYTKIEGKFLGGHAVKIIGWGLENGVPYWLINNYWGTEWGMGGQFKYLLGEDVGGIEAQCVAADPKCANVNAYSNEYYCRTPTE